MNEDFFTTSSSSESFDAPAAPPFDVDGSTKRFENDITKEYFLFAFKRVLE